MFESVNNNISNKKYSCGIKGISNVKIYGNQCLNRSYLEISRHVNYINYTLQTSHIITVVAVVKSIFFLLYQNQIVLSVTKVNVPDKICSGTW